MKIETDFLVIGSGIAGLSFALNGANRLASNSLLEAVVFTEPSVQAASVYLNILDILPWNLEGTFNQDKWGYLHYNTDYPQRDDKLWKYDTYLSQSVI